MLEMDKKIFDNVVSAIHCKILSEKGFPHQTKQFWLWNQKTNICTLRGYFFDIEGVLEQGDNNIMSLCPWIQRFPAYTTNDLMDMLGDFTLLRRQGMYKLSNITVCVTDKRFADAVAKAVFEMLDKGFMCSRTFKLLRE